MKRIVWPFCVQRWKGSGGWGGGDRLRVWGKRESNIYYIGREVTGMAYGMRYRDTEHITITGLDDAVWSWTYGSCCHFHGREIWGYVSVPGSRGRSANSLAKTKTGCPFPSSSPLHTPARGSSWMVRLMAAFIIILGWRVRVYRHNAPRESRRYSTASFGGGGWTSWGYKGHMGGFVM